MSVRKTELMVDKERKRGRPPHQTPSAVARRSNIHPIIRDLIAWRRQRRLSQVAAAQWAQTRGVFTDGLLHPDVGRRLETPAGAYACSSAAVPRQRHQPDAETLICEAFFS